ncbi:MAG: hypothetical protein JNK67_16155 [Alphaproteobacteria bacterium]|nr:hypothetical protein [Alphaproteobacteria bacterium]
MGRRFDEFGASPSASHRSRSGGAAAHADIGLEPWRRAGCHRDPCSPSPDPALFYASTSARKIQSALLDGLETGDGCLFLVTGTAGVGKTMHLRVLDAVLRTAGESVMLHDGDDDAAPWLGRLLAEPGAAGARRTVDLVDGGESFSDETMTRLTEGLRLSAGRRFGARLVIAARPEFEARLYALVKAALSSQIDFTWLRIEALDAGETENLVIHRLRRCGYFGGVPLAPDAWRRIHHGSDGVPRRILELASAALDAEWRRAVALDAGDARRGSPGALRHAFAAASLPALVVSAWMLLPSDAIRWGGTGAAQREIVVASIEPASGPSATSALGAARLDAMMRDAAEAPLGTAAVSDLARSRSGDAPASEPPAATTDATAMSPQERTVLVAASAGALQGPDADAVEPPRSAIAGAPLVPLVPPAWEEPHDTAAIVHPVETPAPPMAAQVVAAEPAGVSEAPQPVAGADALARGAATFVAPPEAYLPPVAAAVSIEIAQAAPAPAAAPASAPTAEQIAALIRRGDEQAREGSIAAARLFYERAAAAGDPRAMRALARSYEADELRRLGVVGMNPDPERAAFWHRKALEAEAAAPRARR